VNGDGRARSRKGAGGWNLIGSTDLRALRRFLTGRPVPRTTVAEADRYAMI